MEPEPLLSAVGVTKSYGSMPVLKGVDIDVRPGEIHALVGENGAGKSTLVNILAGYLAPDGGTVAARGEVIWDGPDRVTAESSVGMVHQELSVLPDLTVKENLLIGDPEVGFFNRRRRDAEIAGRRLDEIGLTGISLDRRTETLSLAEQQLLEIARIVGRKQSVIVLDEPTATLSDAEIEIVFVTLNNLREAGHGVLYISHRLREIFTLADRVTTLRNGLHIATDPIDEIDTDLLVEKMLGESQSEKRHELEEAGAREGVGSSVIEVKDLRSPSKFESIDLSVRGGQILGIIGQVGSGADDVVRAIAGLDPLSRGEITIAGRRIESYGLKQAQRHGIWCLSESRKRDGLFLASSVVENLTSPVLGRVSRMGVVNGRRQRAVATRLAERFTVRVNRLESPVENLSGGNQQKVAVAKAVSVEPRVLVLSEPTRGVDVGARTEIYEQLRGLLADGVAVVCFTSDVTEAIELCDEIVTMFRGRKISERTVREGIEAELLGDILHGGDSI